MGINPKLGLAHSFCWPTMRLGRRVDRTIRAGVGPPQGGPTERRGVTSLPGGHPSIALRVAKASVEGGRPSRRTFPQGRVEGLTQEIRIGARLRRKGPALAGPFGVRMASGRPGWRSATGAFAHPRRNVESLSGRGFLDRIGGPLTWLWRVPDQPPVRRPVQSSTASRAKRRSARVFQLWASAGRAAMSVSAARSSVST